MCFTYIYNETSRPLPPLRPSLSTIVHVLVGMNTIRQKRSDRPRDSSRWHTCEWVAKTSAHQATYSRSADPLMGEVSTQLVTVERHPVVTSRDGNAHTAHELRAATVARTAPAVTPAFQVQVYVSLMLLLLRFTRPPVSKRRSTQNCHRISKSSHQHIASNASRAETAACQAHRHTSRSSFILPTLCLPRKATNSPTRFPKAALHCCFATCWF